MKNPPKPSFFMASYKADDFYLALANYEEFLGKLKPEQDFIRTQKYSSSTLKISRRVLSHWRKVGLLDESDTTKLSYVECFWISVANELRQFGLSLKKIKKVKDNIFNPEKEPLLTFYLYNSFKKDIEDDYFLLVNSKGESDIGSSDEIDAMEDLNLLNENYIKINFNLVKARLANKPTSTLKSSFINRKVLPTEKKIIEAVRSGEYKKVAIRFKSGVATHLEKESVTTADAMTALKSAISEQSFGKIELTQQDGKVISVKNTATEKL